MQTWVHLSLTDSRKICKIVKTERWWNTLGSANPSVSKVVVIMIALTIAGCDRYFATINRIFSQFTQSNGTLAKLAKG